MFCVMAVQTGYFSLMLSRQGYSESAIGQVATITGCVSLIMPTILGRLCDRRQLQKTLFILAAVIGPLAYAGIQKTNSFAAVVFWAMMFYGFCLGPQSIPSGWVALLNSQGRNIDFGFTRSFGSLSFAVFSVILGVIVEKYTVSSLPAILLLFGVITAVCACLLPKPEKQADQEVKKEKADGFGKTMKALLTNKPYLMLLLVTLLFNIPNGSYNTYFSVFFVQMGGTESALGIALFVLAIVEVPVMFFYSKLEKKFGVTWLLALSALGYGLKNLLLSFAPNLVTVVACLTLQVLGLALSVPACQSFVAACTPVKYSSTAQTFQASIQSLGFVLANLLCSWLVNFVDLRALLRITSYFGFAGALLFVVSVCLPAKKRGGIDKL